MGETGTEDQRARIEELERKLERLEARATEQERLLRLSSRPAVREADAIEEPVSRRGLLRRAGMAVAAGSGLAVGGSLLNPTPAAAAQVVGDSSTTDGVLGVTSSEEHSGVRGYHPGSGAGVIGVNEGGGPGLRGFSPTGPAVSADSGSVAVLAQGHEGMALYGSARLPLVLEPAETPGPPPAGRASAQGAMRVDSNARLWICIAKNDPGTWVQNITSGENKLDNDSLIVRHTGVGSAVYANNTSTTNARGAVRGVHSGRGPGVQGESTTGAGGRFSGKTAQVQLIPSTAPTRPTSGNAGDLFVDASNRLWFCKGATTWKQLA